MFGIFYIIALYTTLTTQYVSKNISELTDTTYEAMLNEPDRIKLVKFYMPTCGHCMQFRPTFEAISNKLKKHITSHTYNISVHKLLGSKLGIDSAPRTFVLKSLNDYKEINSRDQAQIITMVHSFYNEKFKATSLRKFKDSTKDSSFFYIYIGSHAPMHILDFLYKEKKNKVPIFRLKKAPKYLRETNINQKGLFSYNKGKLVRYNNEHTVKDKYLNNFKWRSERGYNNYIVIKENSCRNKFINTLTDTKQNKNEIIYILVVNNISKKNKELLKEFNSTIDSFHNTDNTNTKLKRYFVLDLYNNGNTNLLNKVKKATFGQIPPLLITINKESSKIKPLFLSKTTDMEQVKQYILDAFKAVEDNKAVYKFPMSTFDLKSMRFMSNNGLCSDKSLNKFRELSEQDLKLHSHSSAPLLVVRINFNSYISSPLPGLNNLIEKLEELPNYIINIKNYTLTDKTASLVVIFKEETKNIGIDEHNLNESSIDGIVKQIKRFIVAKLKDTKDIVEYINDTNNPNSKIDQKKALQKAISESGNKHKIIIFNKKFSKKNMNKLKILKEILKENFALFIADKETLPEINFPINLKFMKSKKMEFILLLAPNDNDNSDNNENEESEKIVKFDSFYYNDVFDFKKIMSFINDRRFNFNLDLLVKDYQNLQFSMLFNKEDLTSNCGSSPCLIKVLKENKDFGDIAEIHKNTEINELFVIGKEQQSSFKSEEWIDERGIVLYFNGTWKSIKADVSKGELEREIKQISAIAEDEGIKDEEL